jgi:DNA-binding response OmpR family regulator
MPRKENRTMREKILVVDDDPGIRELVSVNLEARGFDVRSAGDGSEALALLEKDPPRVVILDVMMPEVDGWEVCKIIRDNYEDDGIKIVLLTARDNDRDRLIGKQILKADEYMTKPFDVAELVSTVERILHDRR